MRKVSKFLRNLRKFDPLVHLFLLIGIVLLFSLVLFMRKQIEELNLRLTKSSPVSAVRLDEGTLPRVTSTTGISLEDVKEIISEIIATISATPKTIIKKEAGKTSYVALGTTATTTSTDWEEVKDAQVYIDLENDFGKDAKVSWEASLKVAHGNGQAYARLYDDTNKIVVLGSEISTTNNSEFKQVSSGNLALWKGRNLYKVQIKSLNSFEVTYSGGRIRVSY